MTESQHAALARVPREDMLVDPEKLAAVLEEPRDDGAISRATLLVTTVAAAAPTIIAALWWAGNH
jgi:hypothetical protein